MTGDLVLVANPGDSTISAFTLDAAAQRLEHLATSPVGKGCSTFAVDEDRDLVHASAKPEDEGGPHGIDTFRLDRTTGTLTPAGHVDTDGGMTYLALAHGGRVLAGAAYHQGFAATWALDADGHIEGRVDRVEWRNAHCVAAHDAFLYVVSLGQDVVAQYHLDPDGRLTPVDPPTVPAPPGSGPRHLVLDADATHAYVVTEFSGEVLSFARDPGSGALTPIGETPAYATDRGLTHSRYGADPRKEHLVWGADVHLARGGRLVLASERTESTLVALRLEDHVAGRRLDLVDVEAQPRGFAVSPDGRYAVVAGELSTEVSLLAVGTDGSLRLLCRVPTGSGANWVRIIRGAPASPTA